MEAGEGCLWSFPATDQVCNPLGYDAVSRLPSPLQWSNAPPPRILKSAGTWRSRKGCGDEPLVATNNFTVRAIKRFLLLAFRPLVIWHPPPRRSILKPRWEPDRLGVQIPAEGEPQVSTRSPSICSLCYKRHAAQTGQDLHMTSLLSHSFLRVLSDRIASVRRASGASPARVCATHSAPPPHGRGAKPLAPCTPLNVPPPRRGNLTRIGHFRGKLEV